MKLIGPNRGHVDGKSFGNALKGVPGTVFEVQEIKFTVLDEKDRAGNRRDNAKRHIENN